MTKKTIDDWRAELADAEVKYERDLRAYLTREIRARVTQPRWADLVSTQQLEEVADALRISVVDLSSARLEAMRRAESLRRRAETLAGEAREAEAAARKAEEEIDP